MSSHQSILHLIGKSPKLTKIVDICAKHPKWSNSYLIPLLQNIYRKPHSDFDALTFLPKSTRTELNEQVKSPISVDPIEINPSQQCQKALFRLHDGASIETVWMEFKQSGHKSVCVSSQVGCALKCNFCATGAIGFKRQLSLDEIVDQIVYFASRADGFVNTVSFMGMGEALLNPRVFEAIKFLNSPLTTNISMRKMSVSTVGIIPGIRRLTEHLPQVNLAFSLHSPFAEQRNLLVPMNKTYPLPDVMEALEDHAQTTNRKIFLAYLLLPGYNDSLDHAKGIKDLIQKMKPAVRGLFHVNLLRYNPAEGINEDYRRTDRDDVESFSKMLTDLKIHHTLRQSFGLDIDAACGQLYGKYQPKAALKLMRK